MRHRREITSGLSALTGFFQLTLLFYNIQKISHAQDCVAGRDHGFAAPADEYDQLVLQSKVCEAFFRFGCQTPAYVRP